MKRIVLAFIVSIFSICTYANTCNYGNVRVTLQTEQISVTNLNLKPHGQVNISVNDTKAKEVTVLIECNGQRRDVTVKLYNGYGSFNLCDYIYNLKSGNTYTVKLINVPGMCF